MPLGSGAVDVSAGDRHSVAGRKPVRHGGGWLIVKLKSSAAAFSNGAATAWATAAPCGRITRRLLEAVVVALEHVDHDLEVRQRLRQRLLDIAEHCVHRIGRRRRLRQSRCATPDPAAAACAAMLFRFAAHRWIASPEFTWLSMIGAELSMMSLKSSILALKSPTIACVPSTSRCNAGPRPPTACDGLVEQPGDLLLRQHRETVVGGVERRADLAGHRALGDRLPRWRSTDRDCRRTPGRGTAHRSPTPSARWPTASTGILYRSAMLIVARAPRLGRLDLGHLADGDAAVGHVGCAVQAARCRQVRLQRVLADARHARQAQVVPAQHDQARSRSAR